MPAKRWIAPRRYFANFEGTKIGDESSVARRWPGRQPNKGMPQSGPAIAEVRRTLLPVPAISVVVPSGSSGARLDMIGAVIEIAIRIVSDHDRLHQVLLNGD